MYTITKKTLENTCVSVYSMYEVAHKLDNLAMGDYLTIPEEQSHAFYNARYHFFTTRAFQSYRSDCGNFRVIRKIRRNAKRYENLEQKQKSRGL